MQRWQGALADRLAREPSHQSVASASEVGELSPLPAKGGGTTEAGLFETATYLSLLEGLLSSDPPTHLPYLISSPPQRWPLRVRTLW